MKIYSVFDGKAQTFSPPFIAKTDAEAIRILESVVIDERTTIGKYPDDYTLFAVGEWNEDSGITSSPDYVKENLGLARQILNVALERARYWQSKHVTDEQKEQPTEQEEK